MSDVTMPQLGETVTEGTITKWFKKVGDRVEQDELLFEVSTDKVDSEVSSPAAGFLGPFRSLAIEFGTPRRGFRQSAFGRCRQWLLDAIGLVGIGHRSELRLNWQRSRSPRRDAA